MARPSLFSYGPRPSCGGKRWAAQDGVTGKEKLESNIKLIYAVASNILINQHANTNRSARILADTELVEFIAVQDQFLTPSARFADLVLPACTQFETWGVEDGWKYGEEVILMPKLVEPLGESKSDYRICAEVAERLGIGEAYTEGRDERGWVEWALGQYRQQRFPELPSLDELLELNVGVYSRPVEQPAVAFADFRADPAVSPTANALRQGGDLLGAASRDGPPGGDPRRCPNTSRSGRAPSAPKRRSIRCRPSVTIPWRACTRPMPTMTGWRRPFHRWCT